MDSRQGQRHALSYVLRMWRVSLQDVRTGERVGFSDLNTACRYLHAQTGLPRGEAAGSGEHSGVPHAGDGDPDARPEGR